MTYRSAILASAWVFALAFVSAMAAEPAFVKKPTASRVNDKVRIDFEVNQLCDVAVYVEDGQGKVVRHLVAGVLGKNPPAPLKPDSLAQSIEWDGRDDDDRPAAGGALKVRVALSLRASYVDQPFAEGRDGPNMLENVQGLATGPDGRLYLLDRCGGWVWSTTKVLVFRRDGKYEKTIKPFPANLPADRARGAGAFVNSFGKFNPLIHRVQGMAFYPAEEVAHQPAVTPAGQVVLAVNNTRLAVIDRDGGIPNASFAGPELLADGKFSKYPFLAPASDGKSVYISGLSGSKGAPGSAILLAPLPAMGPAQTWFGNAEQAGADQEHLNDARGLAADGKGRLLIADFGNNRVLAVNEKDRSVAGTIAVPAPAWVAVDSRNGAVYVQSGDAVIKFAGLNDAKEIARVELPKAGPKGPAPKLALDATADPVVLWVATGSALVRYEEKDGKFGASTAADCYAPWLFWRPFADPTRREVGAKIGWGQYKNKVVILNEQTGARRAFELNRVAGVEGRTHRLDRDGLLYGQDHAAQAGGIIRFGLDGEPKPFEATKDDPYLKGRLPVGFTGTTTWERDFSVARNGDIYVRASGTEYHGLMNVHVYGQDGQLKRIALHVVSDGMYGPRLDARGNMYILECVKPLGGQLFPNEFKDAAAAFPGAAASYNWIYGSVIKFAPAGGAVWFSGSQSSPLDYEGWRCGRSIANLRTIGGNLTGTVAKASAILSFPGFRFDAAEYKTLTVRLKNSSDGTAAMLSFHHLKEGYIASTGPGYNKKIAIQPNSDFTEYTFDMGTEKEWAGILWHLSLSPTDAKSGTFAIDWVRLGGPESKWVWNFAAEDNPDTKLPTTMKKEQVGAYNRKDGATLQGAEWFHFGVAPLGDLGVHNGCHCTGTDFDVDDFGRVFVPDTGRFRVAVLDTHGNDLASFGQYGNQDEAGQIGLAWIVGLAVTDRHAYIDDVINKRIIRVKLDYAAEERCEVK
jgi:hypothetical protein